ncbi:MAG: hypothetical protein JW874_08260 [Spirochaetales bacterium]|nr:hypothetical protein [Spirochaetales bacterium]
MAKTEKIIIKKGHTVPFRNNVDFCVGTGRMGLALQKEYLDQLALVQQEIGFRYIRGHGLFGDDMAVCQAYKDENGNTKYEYNFTYIDLVMDSYLSLGIRPFLELGFMPAQLASGTQTVFYWKANVTPPADYGDWAELVKALLRHLIERYGSEEVIQWPVEVWNEPNLKFFWKDADMQEYFRLYEVSVQAVRDVDPRFRVGGPAICGVDDQVWLRSFLEYVRDRTLPLDFITRHHYAIYPPEVVGHYSYARLHDPEESFRDLETSRAIVDRFPEFRGMEIHITEFNTAYIPDCPLHDTNLNAAYVAAMLARLGDCHASYAYWTFGDIFEERRVPFVPFHGGFGMVANGCIPKPTFWTFAFFKRLTGRCVHRSANTVLMQTAGGDYRGVCWNVAAGQDRATLNLDISMPVESAEYCLVTRTVDEECCNPLKLWHDLGEPSHLSKDQLALLREHAGPDLKSCRITTDDSRIQLTLQAEPNALVYFELRRAEIVSDRGFSYERVTEGEGSADSGKNRGS